MLRLKSITAEELESALEKGKTHAVKNFLQNPKLSLKDQMHYLQCFYEFKNKTNNYSYTINEESSFIKYLLENPSLKEETIKEILNNFHYFKDAASDFYTTYLDLLAEKASSLENQKLLLEIIKPKHLVNSSAYSLSIIAHENTYLHLVTKADLKPEAQLILLDWLSLDKLQNLKQDALRMELLVVLTRNKNTHLETINKLMSLIQPVNYYVYYTLVNRKETLPIPVRALDEISTKVQRPWWMVQAPQEIPGITKYQIMLDDILKNLNPAQKKLYCTAKVWWEKDSLAFKEFLKQHKNITSDEIEIIVKLLEDVETDNVGSLNPNVEKIVEAGRNTMKRSI